MIAALEKSNRQKDGYHLIIAGLVHLLNAGDQRGLQRLVAELEENGDPNLTPILTALKGGNVIELNLLPADKRPRPKGLINKVLARLRGSPPRGDTMIELATAPGVGPGASPAPVGERRTMHESTFEPEAPPPPAGDATPTGIPGFRTWEVWPTRIVGLLASLGLIWLFWIMLDSVAWPISLPSVVVLGLIAWLAYRACPWLTKKSSLSIFLGRTASDILGLELEENSLPERLTENFLTHTQDYRISSGKWGCGFEDNLVPSPEEKITAQGVLDLHEDKIQVIQHLEGDSWSFFRKLKGLLENQLEAQEEKVRQAGFNVANLADDAPNKADLEARWKAMSHRTEEIQLEISQAEAAYLLDAKLREQKIKENATEVIEASLRWQQQCAPCYKVRIGNWLRLFAGIILVSPIWVGLNGNNTLRDYDVMVAPSGQAEQAAGKPETEDAGFTKLDKNALLVGKIRYTFQEGVADQKDTLVVWVPIRFKEPDWDPSQIRVNCLAIENKGPRLKGGHVAINKVIFSKKDDSKAPVILLYRSKSLLEVAELEVKVQNVSSGKWTAFSPEPTEKD